MNELEESIVREYNYTENRRRMTVVQHNFKIARITNVYLNLIIGFISIASMILWLSFTNAGIKHAIMLAEEIGQISFPGEALTCLAAPAIAIMTYIADVFFIKKLNRICQIIYAGIGIFALCNLFIAFEPMHLKDMLLMIVYAIAGLWTQDFAIRNYKELDYLSKQEGFPEFLFVIEANTHSKFTKYRRKWLNKEKKLDYFTDSERPVTDYNVIAAETDNKMDGISVDDNIREKWFEPVSMDNNGNDASQPDGSMDDIEPSMLLDEDDYIIDDIRKKPL